MAAARSGHSRPTALPSEYDNLLIGHADRTRVIDHAYRYVIFTGTLLVDGFVQATWNIKRGRDAATLTIEPLRRLTEAGSHGRVGGRRAPPEVRRQRSNGARRTNYRCRDLTAAGPAASPLR